MKKNVIHVIIQVVILALGLNGIGIVAYALDYPHNSLNNYGCSSCHSLHGGSSGLLPPHEPQDIDDTKRNVLCWSCHNDDVAPYVKTHSSLTTDNGYGDWTAECTTCHEPHQQKQFRDYDSEMYYLYRGTSTSPPPTGTTLTQTGAGWTLNAYKGLIVVPNIAEQNYNYKITWNTADTLTVAGPMDLGKVSEGDTFVIIYGKLIRSEISTPNSGDRATRLFRSTGNNSFADGDTAYDGVCEVCHTQTIHFRYGGLGVDQLHTNVGGPAGGDCIDCHAHENGFGHGGGGDCIPCHGHDKDTEYDPDASAPYTPGATASQGKGTYQSHSTHTESDSDDLRGPGIYCDTCHDINNFPSFISGTIIIDDGKYDLDETDVCDTCHSPDGPFDGVAEGKANWGTAPVSCKGCHDTGTSTIQGVDAPPVAGDNATWGFYANGHDRNGFVACTDCHDPTSVHLDGLARTYSFDSAYYGPDQSGVKYAEGYRLQNVGGEVPLMIPANYNLTFSYNAQTMKDNAFRLCFSCHDASILLDDTPGDGIDSSFKASLPNPPRNYSYAWGSGADVNEHVSHLMNYIGPFADSDWDTATNGPGGSDGRDSMTACSNCHNVHGAAGTEGSINDTMIRDGSLTGRTGYGFSYVFEDTGGYPWVTSTGASRSTSVGAIFRSNTADMCGGSMCHGDPAAPPASSYDATGSSWGTYLEYYRPPTGIDTYTCTACHGQPPDGNTAPNRAGSHATHFTSANGPQIAPDTCDACHLFSTATHNDGEVTFADSLPLAATNACDTCHSPDGDFNGVDTVDDSVGARDNWDSGVYTGADLQAGKEKWCGGCHDEGTSIINGISAPPVGGDSATWGYFATGHGRQPIDVKCITCHDSALQHTDGTAHTYEVVADNYQPAFRLKDVNGGPPLAVPRAGLDSVDAYADPPYWELCFTCHDKYKLLGSPTALAGNYNLTEFETNFRSDSSVIIPDGNDTDIAGYSISGAVDKNSHKTHLAGPPTFYDSDRDGAGDSYGTCVACHNVHGSTSPAMIRDGKLIGMEPALNFNHVRFDRRVAHTGGGCSNPSNEEIIMTSTDVTLADSHGGVMRADSGPGNNGVCNFCHGSGSGTDDPEYIINCYTPDNVDYYRVPINVP